MNESMWQSALSDARADGDLAAMTDLVRVALGDTCRHELWDGNVDDPSYAYCDMPSSHAGPHHYSL